MMEQMPMQPAAMIAALDVDSPPPLSISCGCRRTRSEGEGCVRMPLVLAVLLLYTSAAGQERR